MGDPVVHGELQGSDELEGRVRCSQVDELRAGRHRVNGLEVQCLLAIPALLVGDVASVLAAVEDLLAIAGLGQAVPAAVLLQVAADGRGREGVDHGDLLARAVVAAPDGVVDAVGVLKLLRRVAAGGPGLDTAVGGRLVARESPAPVVGAGRCVLERGRRRRVGRRQRLVGLLADPEHPVDVVRDRRRHRQRRSGSAQRLMLVAIELDRGVEGAVDLVDGADGIDQHPARGDARDCEPVVTEPVLHLVDLRHGRGEAGAEGGGREVVAVAWARRVGYRLIDLVELARVAPRERDVEVHSALGRPNLCGRGRIRRHAAAKDPASGGARRSVHSYCRDDHHGRRGQSHRRDPPLPVHQSSSLLDPGSGGSLCLRRIGRVVGRAVCQAPDRRRPRARGPATSSARRAPRRSPGSRPAQRRSLPCELRRHGLPG